MQYLFSPSGEDALEAVMKRSPLLAFDFDGTLAPIVSRPEVAHMPKGWSAMVKTLALRMPVAVVTGRSVADVSTKLGFQPHYIIGNHGAEDPEGALGTGSVVRLDAMRRKLALLKHRWAPLGIELEDKRYSMALHYRLASDMTAAQACIHELVTGADTGLHFFPGKCVMNIAPSDAPDKASAVMSLVSRAGAGAAIFSGDDVNDEPVFERAPPDWLTLKVGLDRTSAARFFVESHEDIERLLQRLLQILQRSAQQR
jgi:trehalose 6-phosphate phosphatase